MTISTSTPSRNQPVTPDDPGIESLPPEQDWCPHCAIDEDDLPGLPVDVIGTSIETEVQTIHGTGPTYLVQELACGHHLATLQNATLVLDDVA